MRKITAAAMIATLFIAGTGKAEGLSYYDGIEDSLLVLQKQYVDNKVDLKDGTVKSKGYVLFAQISDLSTPELVNYSAIGYRSGYPVFFARLPKGDTVIVFDTFERKADALYKKRELEKDFGLKHLSIQYYPKELPKTYVIANGVIRYIDRHYQQVIQNEQERCGKEIKAVKDAFAAIADGQPIETESKFLVNRDTCQEYIEADRLARDYGSRPEKYKAQNNPAPVVVKGPLQVINRVITKAYLDKNYNGKVRAVTPIRSKYADPKSYETQKKKVAQNIIEKRNTEKRLSEARDLNAFFAILRENAALDENGNLILDKKAYAPGSTFGKYTIYKTDYKKGLVVVKSGTRRKAAKLPRH